MARRTFALLITFGLGVIIGGIATRTMGPAYAAQGTAKVPALKPVKIVHFYTGSDNQTHFDEIATEPTANVFKMLPVAGAAELHHALPGSPEIWHTAPRRQYVITLSGHAEIEGADGRKISVEPGEIEFAEDLTGKGHITRVVGNEDRVSLWLPLADQSPPLVPSK
jgi:hypothetical protein